MKDISTHAKFDEMVDPKTLKPHPKNANRHGQDQIDRLAKLYEVYGVRTPIIVSKRSGYIVAGHCRVLSALRAGLKTVPVVYQDFESDEKEYGYLVSENAISSWADMNLSAINAQLEFLGPDFNLDDLGIKDFVLDMGEKEFDPEFEEEDKTKRCPHCGEIL